MKKISTLFLFIGHICFSQTNISGPISSNTTWDVGSSPYTITANTVIMDGVTLTINAGVTVLFSQDVYLKTLSGGTLIAQGTETDSIYFTVTDKNTVTNTEGIEFASGAVGSTVQNDTTYVSGSVFDYCVFKDFITTGAGGVMSAGEVSLLIKNSSFLYNKASDGGVFSFTDDCGSTKYLVRSIFNNNMATGNGGVITQDDSWSGGCPGTYKYINSSFNNNHALNGGVISGANCGNYCNTGQHELYNCNFSNNTASGNGGVFYASSIGGGGFTATNSLFKQNTSNQGGVYFGYWGRNLFSFYNSTFISNGSVESGGVCYWSTDDISRNFIIDQCRFINNYSVKGTSVIKMVEGRTGGDKSLSGSNNYFFGNKSYSDNIDGQLIYNNDFEGSSGINLSSSLFIANGIDTTFANNSLITGQFVGSNNAFINNNSRYYLKFLPGGTSTISSENNYWGTKSSTVIDSLIYDFNDDPNFNSPIFDYTPFLLAPPDTLIGSPSSITSISLKTNLNYLTDLPQSNQVQTGDTLFIEVHGVGADTLLKGFTVILGINRVNQDTIVKTLLETSENSGIYRGEVYTSTTTNKANDILKYSNDNSLLFLSRMNKEKKISFNNSTPVITAVSDITIKEDEPSSITLSATDTEDDAITYSAASDTNAVTASVSSDTLTLTPKADWNGNATITAYASDGSSTDSSFFKLTVTPVNDTSKPFFWNTVESDSINITKNNLASTYDLDWTESVDVDGDTIDYIVYAKIGQYPAEEIFDTTATSYSILYEDIAEGAFDGLPGNRATVHFSVWAHDGTDSVKISRDDRVLYVNRYEYLSIESEGIPTEFALHENYPNPFNPTTQIRFDLPKMSNVTLAIYNMLGQKVKTFNMQSAPAGYHALTWNATNDLGAPVSGGVYLYQLQTKGFSKTKKMVLLK